jgi:hypothetical protein
MPRNTIMGKARCRTYILEVLRNYKFNRDGHPYFEEISEFICKILPLGYNFLQCDRKKDNNQKCFLFYKQGTCEEVIIYFRGTYDAIESFEINPGKR